MPDVLYRFRSIKNLLCRKELERHQIYLARPDELNDPMEGYKNVVWRGDPVLWENLLGHYVLALLWTTLNCMLIDDGKFDKPTIPAFLTEDDLPTDTFRAAYSEACDQFFK